ncbi:MAG: phosphate signaling complex protein PhoU [Acidimicrobiia bacterium]|jgi:phosphate transport system protein|nr:phosphate signaling complex protein PhoU [Acidimicrobiia bacterium]
MTNDRTPHAEIRHRFDAELEEIKRASVALGSLVLENAGRLTEALLENHLELAQQVIDADDGVDRAYIDLERRVFRVIALQQPVASDLRFLISIIRVAHEIERSGDLVVNCAKGIVRQQGFHLGSQMQGLLARLCRAALDLFARGIDSLADMDANAGPRLDQEDDEVDSLVGEFYTLLANEVEGMPVDTAIELSRVGRYMERIADHAVNVGEHIGFIVTGIFPRHSSIDEG